MYIRGAQFIQFEASRITYTKRYEGNIKFFVEL